MVLTWGEVGGGGGGWIVSQENRKQEVLVDVVVVVISAAFSPVFGQTSRVCVRSNAGEHVCVGAIVCKAIFFF